MGINHCGVKSPFFPLISIVGIEDRNAETLDLPGFLGLTYPGNQPILRIARAKERKPNVILHRQPHRYYT